MVLFFQLKLQYIIKHGCIPEYLDSKSADDGELVVHGPDGGHHEEEPDGEGPDWRSLVGGAWWGGVYHGEYQ